MGLIFALKKTDSTSGTAYIVGKEYLTPQYVGYSNEGNQNATDDRKKLYNVQFWLNNQMPGSNLGETYYQCSATSNIDNDAGNAITISSFNQKNPSTFTGKSDTKAYINNVNNVFLPILIRKYPMYAPFIKVSGSDYSISSMENLNSILTNIPNIANQNLEQMQCLLFPYFYETYLVYIQIPRKICTSKSIRQSHIYVY